MFAQVLAGAMQPRLYGGDAGGENFGDFRMAAAFLDQGEQGTILGTELVERVAEGIEFFGINRARGLGNVLVLGPERQKNPAEFLAAELINAGIAGETEQPGFELGRRLETIDGPDHLDEDLLGKIFDIIAASGHGVHETGHPMLVADNELPLGVFIALLSPTDQGSQRGRSRSIHALCIVVSAARRPEGQKDSAVGPATLQSTQPLPPFGVGRFPDESQDLFP